MSSAFTGVLRLTLGQLLSVRLQHLLSRADLAPGASLRDCGAPTEITGFTEWVSLAEPAVSLGWDWLLVGEGGAPRCVRVGPPRSNVALVDDDLRDLNWARNLRALSTVVDALGWSEATCEAIGWRRPTYQT